jgi:osmotically inducible protein OsmC
MTDLETVLYTGKSHTLGGRMAPAAARMAGLTSSCRLRLTPAPASPPEQLFAAGWSACFIGAMGRVARSMKIALPGDVAVDAEVDLGTSGDQFLLRACLNVSLPGLERDVARAITEAAHQVCPYSKATRGNIDVTINLI